MSRLWIDANVILRFLTGEPEDLYTRSASLMARADQGEVRLVVSELVVAEVIWVLKSFYKHSMEEIKDVMKAFLSAPGIETAQQELMLDALELAAEKNVDFIDAVLALQASSVSEEVCTFDKSDFKKLPVRWSSPPERRSGT